MFAILDSEVDISATALKHKLRSWRCGRLREPVTNLPVSNRPFTVDEVRWHEFKATRMYTIINGDVYDLTGMSRGGFFEHKKKRENVNTRAPDYADVHPGGERILAKWAAGRDSTDLFSQMHADADKFLERFQYLKVGRVVESYGFLENIDIRHKRSVVLEDNVYSLRRKCNE